MPDTLPAYFHLLMANKLSGETSPYLLQHANNPVEWHPWGPEALARAKAEDKAIFLSIGYSACHWCHVMEHESFEDEQIAALLNERFVCIKVDREERPDLDQIYMNAVQLMTGRGGWPMSVFLTPSLKPFYGGTYWPPRAGRGMPGFDQVILAVGDAWQNRREQALEQATELTKHLQQVETTGESTDGLAEGLRLELLQLAATKLERAFDFANGGFGRAPKFPHSMDVQVLLRVWRRWPSDVLLDMVKLNLDKMARGGIYDHLAGGFARYSVDERWLVPHFEKMLYDNALLASAYLDGYLATRNEEYARVARETFDYLLAYMTDEQGGFHSTEDADSEGVEGKFYVWTPAEVEAVLGAEKAARFCYVYDVTDGGNFEHGQSILNLPKTIPQCAQLRGWNHEQLEAELADSRAKLLAVRDRRVRPAKDDKILVSWNALLIDSFARGAGILGEPRYLAAASRAADFLLANLKRPDGRLLHSWRQGRAKFDAYLDDYAYLANALVSLYEASFEERWVEEAVRLANQMLTHFADKVKGGFYFTADDHEQLISRQKDLHDSSVPSGNSMAATALLRLGALCGRTDYTVAAHETLANAAAVMERSPSSAGQMLLAADLFFGPLPEIVILGDPADADTAHILADLRRRYIPNKVVACRATVQNQVEPDASPREMLLSSGLVAVDGSPDLEPIFVGKVARDGLPAVFVCQDFTCHTPASGKGAVLNLWGRLAGAP